MSCVQSSYRTEGGFGMFSFGNMDQGRQIGGGRKATGRMKMRGGGRFMAVSRCPDTMPWMRGDTSLLESARVGLDIPGDACPQRAQKKWCWWELGEGGWEPSQHCTAWVILLYMVMFLLSWNTDLQTKHFQFEFNFILYVCVCLHYVDVTAVDCGLTLFNCRKVSIQDIPIVS